MERVLAGGLTVGSAAVIALWVIASLPATLGSVAAQDSTGIVLAAVDTVRVDTTNPCPTCSIQLIHAAAFGGRDASFHLALRPLATVDSRGSFFALPFSNDRIVRVTSDGREDEPIGRPGRGPGEFGRITNLAVDAQDTLFVLDGRGGISVFSPEGRFMRSFPFPVMIAHQYTPLIRLPGGDLLVGGIIPTPDRIGYPLHRVSPDGDVLLSFGQDQPTFDRPREWASNRIFAFDGEQVWASVRHRYEIEAWDPGTGEKRQVLIRSAPWLPPRDDRSGDWRRPGDPVPPSLVAIRFDPSGLLWVLARDTFEGMSPETPADVLVVQPTVIEVIDPVSGRLVAPTRVPEYVRGFAGDGVVYSSREDRDGFRVVDVWRLRLLGNPS